MGLLFSKSIANALPSIHRQNEAGEYVDLYVPRKCSASNRIIAAKDNASVQMIIADVDEKTGRMLPTAKTYAISGPSGGWESQMTASTDWLRRTASSPRTSKLCQRHFQSAMSQ